VDLVEPDGLVDQSAGGNRGHEDRGAAARLVQRSDSHRHSAVADADQHDGAEELGDSLPTGLPPASGDGGRLRLSAAAAAATSPPSFVSSASAMPALAGHLRSPTGRPGLGARHNGGCRAWRCPGGGRSKAKALLAGSALGVLGAGRTDGSRPDPGQPAAGAPGAGPADRVVVVADQPFETARHGEVVEGQHAGGAWAELQGDARTTNEDAGLTSGRRCSVGHPARELGRGAELVELVGLVDAVAVASQLGRSPRARASVSTALGIDRLETLAALHLEELARLELQLQGLWQGLKTTVDDVTSTG
jgi:hypothetical protein